MKTISPFSLSSAKKGLEKSWGMISNFLNLLRRCGSRVWAGLWAVLRKIILKSQTSNIHINQTEFDQSGQSVLGSWHNTLLTINEDSFICIEKIYRISSYSFRGNYSFLNLEIQRSQYLRPKVTVHKCAETIQG